MWSALQDAARIMTLVLDKSGESHRKCPRCRGSGLLENSFTKLEKKGAHPNEPCWFCEGIGALPIVGLNGFVLARTIPCLKVLDNQNQTCADILHFNHSRYGDEETSKFTNAKLGVNLADLSFDFHTSPWINCTGLGCQQQNVLEKSKAKESICQPRVSEPRLQPLSSFSHKEPCLRNGFLQRILNAPLVLSIVSNSQPNATLFSAAPSVSSLKPSTVLVPVKHKAANTCPAHKLRGGFSMQHVSYTWKTSHCNVSTIDNLQLESEFSRPFVTKLQTETASSVLGMKRQRPQQKGRNCIRDKARKEAQERAGGLLRTLKYKDEPDSANSYVQPACTETTSKSLNGLGALGEHFPPLDMASKVACLMSVAVVSRQLLLNQLIADG